jgi:hypothetical protein
VREEVKEEEEVEVEGRKGGRAEWLPVRRGGQREIEG